jgi:site-specific DNA-methyltransferase (adenine-specific)
MKPHYADDSVTLYHGDALAVLRESGSESVDAIVTDPPYKISQEYSANADPDNLLAVASLLQVAPELYRVAKPGALVVMYYDTRILPLALHAMNDAGFKYLRALTFYRRWGNAHKLAGWMSTSDFILVFTKPGAPFKFNGPWKHDVYVRSTAEVESLGHPAQKPIDDVSHLVVNVCPPGGTVLDPYSGSGTTGLACINGERKFIGIEISKHYADVSAARFRSATSQGVLDFGEAS